MRWARTRRLGLRSVEYMDRDKSCTITSASSRSCTGAGICCQVGPARAIVERTQILSSPYSGKNCRERVSSSSKKGNRDLSMARCQLEFLLCKNPSVATSRTAGISPSRNKGLRKWKLSIKVLKACIGLFALCHGYGGIITVFPERPEWNLGQSEQETEKQTGSQGPVKQCHGRPECLVILLYRL